LLLLLLLSCAPAEALLRPATASAGCCEFAGGAAAAVDAAKCCCWVGITQPFQHPAVCLFVPMGTLQHLVNLVLQYIKVPQQEMRVVQHTNVTSVTSLPSSSNQRPAAATSHVCSW
jgi:hypothetical protein